MAGTTSIEDILSSVVDETAVSALIGSLESKLAAGNTASTSSPLDSTSVGSNHVGEIGGTVGEVPGPGLQNNAGRDGQSAALAAAGPGSAITATVSPQLGAGSSKTQESLASSALGNASISHLGGEKKMGTEPATGKNINNSASNANTAGPLQNRSRPNTPTTCVRIITLPAGMGAGNAVTTASTIHTRSIKNTVLSSARTLAKTVGTTSITTVQGQSVLHSGAVTAVTSSAMSSGLSLSTGLGVIKKELQTTTHENAQSNVMFSANSSIREQLSSGAKQPIMTNVISTTTNTTNTPAQIVLRSTPMSTFQSSNVGKMNASGPSVVTVASTMASQMKVISTASPYSGPQVQQVRLSSPQVIAPRTPGGPMQLRLPHGASLPPGVMLINKDGNIHAVVNSSIASSSQLQQLQSGTLPGGVAFRQPGSPAVQRPGSQPTSIIQTGGVRQNMGQLSNQLKGRTQVVVGNPPLTFFSKAGTPGLSSVSMSGQGLQSTAARGTSLPSAPQAGNQPQQIPMSQSAMENVKKCRNFLTTLIKLASNGNQPAETVKNVKELVQNLIDGKTEPEEFTLKLQRELRSSPQPYLIPFLKKSLPLLRQTLQKGGSIPIQGLSAPTVTAAQTSISSASGTLSAIAASQPTLVSTLATGNRTGTLNLTHQQLQQLSQHHLANRSKQLNATQINATQLNATQLQTFAQKAKTTAATTSSKTSSPSQSSSSRSSKSSSHSSKSSSKSSSSSKKDKVKDHSASGFKDDDDINDVTSMAGVNLSEESARILATNADFIGTQLRSIKEEKFLFSAPLQAKVNDICVKHGIQEASSDLMELVSHAAQERLRGLVEKLGVIAMHRLEVYRNDSRYEVTSEVKTQLKFFEQLDSLERKRREEQERELLIRAAKSRSKQEDPEQARLKQKAKEMQQMELEQIRQQQANMTALAAIGPRKKRKLDSPTPGSVSGTSSTFLGSGSPGGSSVVSQFRRIKRVNFRDLIFLMEQEQELKKSQFFFKMFLK